MRLIQPVTGSFAEDRRVGREVNHSLSSSAKIRNEWSYSSSSPICLHGVDNETFTSTILRGV